MYEEIQVLTHSSIRITGEQTIYFDPFQIKEQTNDADIIFVTHEHFDHYSPEDIAKVKNTSTILVAPKSMEKELTNSGIDMEFTELVEPGDELEINTVKIEVVASYNVGKNFHTKEKRWVGYVVTMNDTQYYVAGDTDVNEDVEKVNCDVALLPIGGHYTMDKAEAAQLAEMIAPKLAIPTHYGSVAGNPQDGKDFAKLLEDKIPVLVMY
ncbi:MAG: MBL fold metallo-hydrolase [Lachnospiraceae bacterium]|nr:MBL fold metallo-hydrolase [Lachnospiraceae bacterium]